MIASFGERRYSAESRAFGMQYSLIFLLGLTSSLLGGEPEKRPFLRIDAGMHTSQIRSISADAAGRIVLTASKDKTARLWEMPSGKLLHVLRPPIGERNEGELNACALSSDGAVAAVGGWTGYTWDEAGCIYLFDTTSGRLVRRLAGLPQVIFDLVFSDDGRLLAAALGGGKGVRVWETAGWTEVGRDENYGEASISSADWHRQERLVTSCDDGIVRLYRVSGGQIEEVARQLSKGGKRPHSASFSPDGNQIAVGFVNSTKVAVHDGNDLRFRFALDTSGTGKNNARNVVWSSDSSTLVAAGGSNTTIEVIRRWAQAGRGKPKDTPVTTNTVMDLQPLPGGGILFCTADPAWGVLSADGQRTLRGEPPIADYRNAEQKFCLSADGAIVRFSFQEHGKEAARFSLGDRQLALGTSDESGLRAPRVKGLNVTDWVSGAPKLNGHPLVLKQDGTDFSTSFAIAEDASFFLLGTTLKLRAYTAKGEERWAVPTSGSAWAVNLAANDRLAVAAYGDGTIRWYRAEDGQELLAFFPHADKRRWVLWTPEGYFDCSEGGESLIGWHVNRGKANEAEFYPADQLWANFHRPDIIQRVLADLRPASEIAADLGLTFNLEAALRKVPVVTCKG